MLDSIVKYFDLAAYPGLLIFIYFIIKSVKTKISTLDATVKEQERTMKVIKERSDEFEKLVKLQATVFENTQKMREELDNSKETKIGELKEAIDKKDKALAEQKQKELDLIKEKSDALANIDKLREQVSSLNNKIEENAEVVFPIEQLGGVDRSIFSMAKSVRNVNPQILASIKEAAAALENARFLDINSLQKPKK